jgi:uncharacterized membrane protein
MLGTVMAANVFRVIIPQQREMVAALAAGRRPDAERGKQAARRSLHNNYLTLPVLFVMVSHHYPFTYGHGYGWAILAALFVIGAGTRHYFNLRNQGRAPAWLLPAAALGMLGVAIVTAPRSGPGGEDAPSFTQVRAIIGERCTPCHSATPSHPAYTAAPLGVVLDTPEDIRRHAARIAAVTVETQIMPLGNLTGMTPEERALLGRWIRRTAATDGARP